MLQIQEIGSVDSFKALARKVTQQVLVIEGALDRVTPLASIKPVLLDLLKSCTLCIIEDSSHQVMQEKPAEVNAELLRFLLSL